MSCKKATSPIDIKNNNNVLNCRGKCNLNYHYNQSHIIATNKKTFGFFPSKSDINPCKKTI